MRRRKDGESRRRMRERVVEMERIRRRKSMEEGLGG